MRLACSKQASTLSLHQRHASQLTCFDHKSVKMAIKIAINSWRICYDAKICCSKLPEFYRYRYEFPRKLGGCCYRESEKGLAIYSPTVLAAWRNDDMSRFSLLQSSNSFFSVPSLFQGKKEKINLEEHNGRGRNKGNRVLMGSKVSNSSEPCWAYFRRFGIIQFTFSVQSPGG